MVDGPISRLKIENYRSIRSLDVELAPLTVVTGANGVGKSNLYRCLELLGAAARGDLAPRLAREGGLKSAFWAGDAWRTEAERERLAHSAKKGPVQIRLAVQLGDFEYGLAIGAPRPTDAALALDPVVKEEQVRLRRKGRWSTQAQRKGPLLNARNAEGRMELALRDLWLFETALSCVSGLSGMPELDLLRRRLADMRFYHQLRCDGEAGTRRAQPAIMTTNVMSSGENWSTALASLNVIEQDGFRDSDAARAVAAAFPGGELEIRGTESEVWVDLRTAEFRRPFAAQELSDGTLRFLILVAALTALRPPSFIALNEPESSLHESLIEPLADLIASAAERTQILVVTHSLSLADRLDMEHGAHRLHLRKERGETVVA